MGIPSLRHDPADLRREAGQALRRINQHVDDRLETEGALSALERLSRLGMSPSSETSSMGPLAKAMGEAMTGMAKGYQGLSEIQTSMMQQIVGGTQQKGSDPMTQLMVILVTALLQDRQPKSDASEPSVWVQRLFDRYDDEIAELKAQRGASPMDMQMHELTQRASAQAMQNMLDPMGQIKQLLAAKETLAGLGLGGDGGGQYSEGALRAKALDIQADSVKYGHLNQVSERELRRDFMQKGIPTYIAAAGQTLQNALATFGLVPVYQNGGQPPAPGGQRQFSAHSRGEQAEA